MEIQAEEMTLPEIYKNITEGLTGNINVPDEKNIVKVITCSGNNILHLAAKSGQKQIAEDILNNYSSRDISLYHTNANDETPLHIASRLGHCELVKLFLDKKYHEDAEAAKVKLWKMRNKAGDTVLHEAVRNGHLETVKLLIEKDPDLMMMMTIAGVADAEESPLFVAVDRNYFEIALHMISEAKSEKISISGRNGKNALHAAIIRKVHKSHKDLVPNMLNKCPSSIEDRDNFGRIPLHYAAAKGNVKVVRLVLDKDSSLAYKKDNEGMCPLHIAANEGKKSVIKELLTRCPDSCELLDNKNRTSLHFAVQNKSYSTVEILLQTPGFQDLINVQDSEGNTAMHHASILGYVDIIMLLGQSKKVDKGAVNKAGMTVRDIILLKGLDKLDLFELVVMLRSGLWSSLDNFTIRSETTKMQNFDQKVKETAVPVPTSEAETEPAANGLIAARAKREKNNNSDHNATDESVKEMASVNLLVATIIASATFAAMFAMPGGYNDEGLAVASEGKYFRQFIEYSTLAFGASLSVILIHFVITLVPQILGYKYPMRFLLSCTILALASMGSAFSYNLKIVLPHHSSLYRHSDNIINLSLYGPLIYFGFVVFTQTKVAGEVAQLMRLFKLLLTMDARILLLIVKKLTGRLPNHKK